MLPLTAPESPATIRRIPSTGDLLMIWNNTYVQGSGHGGKRTPLTTAISHDEGITWRHVRNLEEDPNQTFAYASLAFDARSSCDDILGRRRARLLFAISVTPNRTALLADGFSRAAKLHEGVLWHPIANAPSTHTRKIRGQAPHARPSRRYHKVLIRLDLRKSGRHWIRTSDLSGVNVVRPKSKNA